MFAAIRRAWQGYLASIPKPDEPERISDKQLVREHFRPPPVPAEVRAAFDALGEIVVSHLPEQAAAMQARRLRAKFRPGDDAANALSAWIHWNCGTQSPAGVIALDWKAREEVGWQAQILAKAHGISLNWDYDVDADVVWKGFQERNEFPVDTPLRSLSQALIPHGIVLYRFGVDDAMYAFAVSRDKQSAVSAQCAFLGIEVITET
jgi:hypothetical protein